MPAATRAKKDPSIAVAGKVPLDKADTRRQEIILAAAWVFARKGYAETTLGDVAKKMKVHTAGLYYYFANKDALVEALLKYAARRILNRAEDVSQSAEGQSARARLEALIRGYVRTNSRPDEIAVAFWKIYDQVSPRLRKTVSVDAGVHFNIWRETFHDAAKEGAVRTDIDPGVLRQLLMGSLVWLQEWYKPSGDCTLDDIADAMIAIFVAPQAPAARATKATAAAKPAANGGPRGRKPAK